MKCRHCLVEFHDTWNCFRTIGDADGWFTILHTTCPACNRLQVAYNRTDEEPHLSSSRVFLYPRAVSREPLDPAVPPEFAGDYIEACNVLDISPKASAALSRRIMQHVLREKAKVKAPNLDQEIQKVLDGNMVPSHIAESLDAVRTVGNFAAHPIKSTSSGEIVDVEAGEAEWNLDTVEALFDFYFVQPEKTRAKRAALNQKLSDAGKPKLK
jgi:Domain of unknown function (DUF4145)